MNAGFACAMLLYFSNLTADQNFIDSNNSKLGSGARNLISMLITLYYLKHPVLTKANEKKNAMK